MQPTTTFERKGLLDAPLLSALSLDWEKVAYVTLITVALVMRLWGVGWRGMSHDESLHAQYSWQLYNGQGYEHNPMMHGPFQFHVVALAYFLFGVNDASARLMAALLGVAGVAILWFFRRWLGRTGAFLAAVMMAISPYMLYYSRYIRNESFVVLFSLLMFWGMFRYKETGEAKWLYLITVGTVLNYTSKEVAFIYVGIFGIYGVISSAIHLARQGWQSLLQDRVFHVLILLGGLSAPLYSPFLTKLLGRDPQAYTAAPFPQSGYMFSAIMYILVFAVATAIAYYVLHRRFLVALAIFYGISIPLFTTFFTNGKGLATGFVGSLGYWLAQQAVQRGSQPWFYYLMVTPLYEFLPMLLSFGGLVLLAVRAARRRAATVSGEAEDGTATAWVVPFLALFTLVSWLAYTIAGEKMPWLSVHLALPMILLGGWFAGQILDRVSWRALKEGKAYWLALLIPLLFYAIQSLVTTDPFAGRTVDQLSDTMQWVAALAMSVVLIYLALGFGLRLGLRGTLQTLFAFLLGLLFLLTFRYTVLANYVNYDLVTEYIGFAHATPDVKVAMNQIAEISRRVTGDKSIVVAYDDDATWPLEWYLREYPNKRYYAANPSRDSLDAPIVIAGDKNWDKVRPFLGDRYQEFKYRLIWWPNESYKGLTWAKFLDGAGDAASRQRLWDIIWRRKYTYTQTEWPHVHRFSVFVRKDVVGQVWSYGAPPAAVAETTQEDPYVRGYREIANIGQWGDFGPGAGPGQLDRPRDVAVDAAGNVYVADSNNHRVQVFAPDGQLLRQWGSVCKLFDEGQPGCQGDGRGQFNEPWGIAVDAEGFVYVTDTWNHRIQKFTNTGEFVTMWGTFAATGGEPTSPGDFWGPRDLIVSDEGNIYVVDTGNKRVQAFSADGTFIAQYGGAGVTEGRFDEPVGMTQDADGNFYVADTWNLRVQKFDRAFTYVGQWPISGWSTTSVVNKPFIVADSEGFIYVSDPENYRIVVFDANGLFRATFGQYGNDATSLALPNGLAVGPDNSLYVADADNHRIVKFAPVR